MFSLFFTKRVSLSKALPYVCGLCLVSGALLFTGCNTDSDDAFFDRQFVPLGTWVSQYEGGEDSYTIETGTLAYKSSYLGSESTWNSVIVAAVDFSPTAGVLIVKITAPTGDYAGHTNGKDYTGVYYTEYSAHSIQFADAWLPGVPYPTQRAEVTTLNEALALFTAGNAGTHVSTYGTYSK